MFIIIKLLNRDFIYYDGDFYFPQEQLVIATMSTVFAIVKESNRVSFNQERKIMFLQLLYKTFDGRFLLEVFEKHLHKTLT